MYVQRCQLSPRRSGISTSSGSDLSPLTWKYLGGYFSGAFFWRDGTNKYFFKEFRNSTLPLTVSSTLKIYPSSTKHHFTKLRLLKTGSGGTRRVKSSTHIQLWETREHTGFASLLNSYTMYMYANINRRHTYIYI